MTRKEIQLADEVPPSNCGEQFGVRKVRDKAATLGRLKQALLEIRSAGRGLSIKAVAEEAGVTPSLIHHVYPDFAEQIRAQTGRSTRARLDSTHDELKKAKRTINEQQSELRELSDDLAKIASINLRLQDRIGELEAQLAGKLTPIAERGTTRD